MKSLVVTILIAATFGVEVNGTQRGELHYSSNLENDGNSVVLGGLFPLHAPSNDEPCDEFENIGVEQVEAMVFAIKSINQDKELLPNVTLGFSIRDTCYTPSHALKQAFQFVQNMNSSCSSAQNKIAVSGVVGAQYSSVSIDIANLLRLHQIPQISHTATSDVLSDKKRFEYFFRVVPPISQQAKAIADIIVALNWRYIFLLYSDDSYGIGGRNAITENLESHSVCVAATIPLSVTSTPSDYDAALRNMSQQWIQNASVAVLFVHFEEATGMMEAMRRFRNGPNRDKLKDITWIGTPAWGDSLPPEYHDVATGALSVTTKTVEIPTFDDYFTSLHPSNYTENVWFKEFWERRFNCSLSNHTGVIPCDLANESITLTVEEHRQFPRVTLIIDAVIAFAHALHSLINSNCPDNKLCPAILINRLPGEAINGELLREHLFNVSFVGPSSNLVTFNALGNVPGVYFIRNLKTVTASEKKFSFDVVGIWHELKPLNISIENIEWASNSTIPESICSRPCNGGEQQIPVAKQQCCWVCTPCQGDKGFSNGIDQCSDCNETRMPNLERSSCVPIPVSYLSWTDTWAIVLIIIALCGIVATACIGTIFIVFRQHKLIKASGREVSAILLVGILLCYLMPFFFMAMPSSSICAIRRFGVGFSFSVCFSALFIKTNRIYRIFNLNSLQPQKALPLVSPLSQVLLIFALIFIQVLIAIIWLAIEPPSTQTQYSSNSAELRCGESPITGLSITLSYNFLLLLLSTYFAFRARKVPENFNETKYINATLYTLCIVWLAFIPTYFVTAELQTVFQTCSLTIAIILSATTTLACLFVPKLILLISHRNNHQETKATTDKTTMQSQH